MYILLSTSALAWFALWYWGQSPYVHYVHYAHLRVSCGESSALYYGFIFVSGWTVMTIAMMLPTSVPLIKLFSTVARSAPDWPRLVALTVAGYLLAWLAVGIVAYGGALLVREAFARSAWLIANAWVLGAVTLLCAGAYQFSLLKYRCLDKCRSPFAFVVAHWTGEDRPRQALWLGAHHGFYCIGCCWAYMMLMFAFGTGNLGWMLCLGVLMAIEKNISWGLRLAKPFGAVLVLAGLIVVIESAISRL